MNKFETEIAKILGTINEDAMPPPAGDPNAVQADPNAVQADPNAAQADPNAAPAGQNTEIDPNKFLNWAFELDFNELKKSGTYNPDDPFGSTQDLYATAQQAKEGGGAPPAGQPPAGGQPPVAQGGGAPVAPAGGATPTV